jgi:hypothetical protein
MGPGGDVKISVMDEFEDMRNVTKEKTDFCIVMCKYDDDIHNIL